MYFMLKLNIIYGILFQMFDKQRGVNMPVSYNKLWKLMIDKNINKTGLKNKAKLSATTIAKLSKGGAISMESMLKICRVLECDIGDIVEIVDETK